MAEHGSVEQELWNIFTFYTPRQPDVPGFAEVFSFQALQAVPDHEDEEFLEGLSGAVINVVYIGELCSDGCIPSLGCMSCQR